MKNFKSDLENYYKMSEPHESSQKANEDLQKFYDKVQEARKEFKIADVVVIVKDSAIYDDGKVGEFFSCAHYGNQLNAIAMAAYAYGKLQADQRELINKLAAGGE